MEFKQAVITRQGRELMAKLMSGKQMSFTKVRVSSTVYPDGQLENLTALTNVKQETDVQAHSNNGSTVSVVAAVNNEGLVSGYDVNTVGLYALDPDKGEILYSVSSASVKGYMPADTGISKSGISFKVYVEVGNAAQVNLEVDPAAVATQSDLMQLKEELKLTEAWANSLDGMVDFSSIRPNQNILVGSTDKLTEVTWSAFEHENIIFELSEHPELVIGERIYYSYYCDNRKGTIPCNALMFFYKKDESLITTSTVRTTVQPGNVGYCKTDLVIPAETAKIKVPFLRKNVSGLSTASYAKNKLELNEYTVWISAPKDNDDKSFLKYYGLALTDSDNPADYVWMESPEYTRYKAQIDNEDFQLAWNSGQQINRKYLIDLKGKVSGNIASNPHFVGRLGGFSDLQSPTNPSWVELTNDNSATGYVRVMNLDANLMSASTDSSGNRHQAIIRWNLVEQVKRDYPNLFTTVGATTLAQQVAFLKANITRFKPSVWGYGSSPTGNKLTLGIWNESDAKWDVITYNSSNVVTNLTMAANSLFYLNSDGFIYTLVYAEPSDGTTPSVVNVDYTSLEYTLSFKKSDFDTVTKKEIGEIKEWIAAHS